MANETTVVHVTHETVGKIGGIGAVLQGLFTCKSYLNAVDRSIIIGPLFTTEGSILDRLGENSEVLYSSIDGLINPGYAPAFRKLESFYNTGIVYGRRTFIDEQTGIKSSPEVLLIDVRHINKGILNEFKKRMYEEFGIRSHLYEHLWEYEQYIRLAPVAIAALKVLDAAKESTVIVAHEFMGMPTALAAILEPYCNFKTVFYAHEVATMRRIIENHPAHDTMFYNVIRQARRDKLYVNEVFDDQSSFFKHALVEAAKYCNQIFAVGDYVVDELLFLAPEFETADINIVYNGVPAQQISVAEKLASKEKLQQYCENLLNFKPDYIFTHVTRLIRSKGLWRDLSVLQSVDKQFQAQGKTAVFFLLSTEVTQRPSHDIHNIESAYNWPVAHREGWPDLSGGEADFYTKVQQFNAQSRNIKVIFINQFGFYRKSCGNRMPEDMEFMDIRKGTDLEFGQSIYEPFGISQLEPLTFGGICVFSSVCGCVGLVQDVAGPNFGELGRAAEDVKNIIVADYTNLSTTLKISLDDFVFGSIKTADSRFDYEDIEDLLQIDRSVREQIEANIGEKVAQKIIQHLPKSESEIDSMIRTGYELAKNMSWDVVVKNYLLSNLKKTPGKVRTS
jgi:glycosyltransferase involved in cell wall biosynthesis